MTDVIADAYATMANFRTFVRNSATTDATDVDTHDELIALEAAARAIERICNRRFTVAGVTATARVFTPTRGKPATTWSGAWWDRTTCDIDDVFDDTGMVVKFDTTGNGDFGDAITTYRLAPLNAAEYSLPYTQLIFDYGTAVPLLAESVQVTALWGWDAIPTTIENANMIQAARFLKRRDAPFGVAGSVDMGSELRLLAKVDPDVAVMLQTYKRTWGAV